MKLFRDLDKREFYLVRNKLFKGKTKMKEMEVKF